jgi:heme exporter protein D
MQEFFHMGGYAFYIWTSYGVALIVLLANLFSAYNRQRSLLKNLLRKLKRDNNNI